MTVRDGATVDATDTFTWTVTKPNVPPAAPTGLSAKVTTTSVVLDWDNNTEPDLAGYFVDRSAGATGPWTRLNATILQHLHLR